VKNKETTFMSYAVFLKLSESSYSRFEVIRMQLNAGVKASQAEMLGGVLSEIACEIIEQTFSELILKQANSINTEDTEEIKENRQVVRQILETLRKYLPWAISFFSNERLLPLVNYFAGLICEHDRQIWIRYDVHMQLMQDVLETVEQIRAGQLSAVPRAFALLIHIIDLGVTCLIREPKKQLKFNVFIDKTLSGVIHMTTHLGYKRLEKIGTQLQKEQANAYIEHFMGFMQKA
jgi:hypothetical protein